MNPSDGKKVSEKKEEQRARKERRQKEKRLNSSMVFLSKRNQEQLGIIAVQPEQNVFCLANELFVKVYNLKSVELTDNRKNVLISMLCKYSHYRMRLSSFSYLNSNTPLVFLTVFFPGDSYAAIVEQISEFDEMLHSLMDNKFKITFTSCNIGDVFMFIYMNFYGQMKKVTLKSVLKKSANLKKNFFLDIRETEGGYMIPFNLKYGSTFICMQYPDDLQQPFEKIKQLGCTYLNCVDFQVTDEKYSGYFNKVLEDIYSTNLEVVDDNKISLTFIINVIYKNEEEMKRYAPIIQEYFYENGLVVAPGTGSEEKIANSISSFGIIDFHCSRNVNINIISKLFG